MSRAKAGPRRKIPSDKLVEQMRAEFKEYALAINRAHSEVTNAYWRFQNLRRWFDYHYPPPEHEVDGK